MRISDWSSDVCSSDLIRTAREQIDFRKVLLHGGRRRRLAVGRLLALLDRLRRPNHATLGIEGARARHLAPEIHLGGDLDTHVAGTEACSEHIIEISHHARFERCTGTTPRKIGSASGWERGCK